MTPLYRQFDRYLPAPIASLALLATYTIMIAAILLFTGQSGDAIIYIDVPG